MSEMHTCMIKRVACIWNILLYVHRSKVAYLGWGQGGRGQVSEGLTADTTQKRPERPWTTTRTMEVLRQCPLTTAQQLVHYAIAVPVSTAVLGSHKDNVHCTAVVE